MPGSIRKAQIRIGIWDFLRRAALLHSPGAYGRTPRFRGASKSAERLRATDVWKAAHRILVLREPVLETVRADAVADGKTLIIPDLTRTQPGWLFEIDPRVLDAAVADKVARQSDLREFESLPAGVRFRRGRESDPVDLMVVGAVAVSRTGDRVGKGAGEADLVYALGRSRGFVTADTPVAVIVHDAQIVNTIDAREPTDLPIDLIVTPEQAYPVDSLYIRPKGLQACMITPKRLADFPGLRAILESENLAARIAECDVEES